MIAGLGHGDTDADTDVDGRTVDRQWRQECVDHPGGDGLRLFVGDPLEKNYELVAAYPTNRVALAYRCHQASGHLDEQLVPDLVAERVVDLLEAVEIHEQHGKIGPAAALAHGVADPFQHRGPVHQPGQRVVRRFSGEGGRDAVALGGGRHEPVDHDEQILAHGVRLGIDTGQPGRTEPPPSVSFFLHHRADGALNAGQ